MEFVVFIPILFLLLMLVGTIPPHIREQRRRKRWLQDYRSNGGQSYVSKWLWDRDGMTKTTGTTWEERQEINNDARMRADMAQQQRDEAESVSASAA